MNIIKQNIHKNDINATVSAIAEFLINDEGSSLETPYKKYLEVSRLDFSLISLRYVDEYLKKVRKKLKILKDDEYTKVILRCGAYVGEVIRKNSKIHFDWKTYDEIVRSTKQLEKFGKSPLAYYILVSSSGNDMAFPMAKVKKFLDFGIQESLYSYAIVIGKFNI